ncbi:RHS repeat-associated core domain-containing protein [uncultured Microbulbifer sp.]|uniref:RHS repeat-associated core domain-containing protein n=1 Tax=uncultured Microbulbifer sp. TaxID=348147 RepID=UPI00344EB74D
MPVARQQSDQEPFQGYDGKGCPVYSTTVFGSLVHGSLALKTSADPDPYFCPKRFQGQWVDEETGLYYNRFRYYGPQATQYMSPDSIEVQEEGVMVCGRSNHCIRCIGARERPWT